MQKTFSPHILWLFLAMLPALVIAQPMAPHAQKGVSKEVLLQSKTLNCGDLVFSLQVINNGSGCCYRLKADNSNPDNCFINVALNLDMGAFANFVALPGWQYNTGGSAEYTVRPFIGFIPPVSSSLAEFCIDGATSATLTLLWEDLCILEGCAATFGVNGCLDPGNASITGVKYRECGSLPYTNQPVLSDWTIQLLDADSNVIAEQVTDVDGAYAFYDLDGGNYTIREVQQPGWTARVPANGQSTVVLDPSEQEVRNFGNCPGCSCDSIYMDVVQLPVTSDTCAYALSASNTGAYCFDKFSIAVATGTITLVTPAAGWSVLQPDAQHVELIPPTSYIPIANFQPCFFRITGSANQQITVSTSYIENGVPVLCSRAFSYQCPPPSSPAPCCPAGSTFGTELVKNSDFQLGNQDFTNDYTYFNPGGPTMIGKYSVLNQAQIFPANSQWACTDHTLLGGQMLVVDGYGGPIAWQQTVNVTAGTSYAYSAWFNNLVLPNKNYDDPQMALFVGNTQVAGPLNLPESTDQWVRPCGTWTAMASGTVVLSIRMLATTNIGNDVAIDDISFRSCIPPPPCQTSIQFTQNTDCTVTVCAVTTGPQPVSYQWCDGRTDACFTAAQLTCVPSSYCVTATCADGTTSTATGTFTGTDITPPVAVCKPGEGVDLGLACDFQVDPAFVDGGSTDNCGIFSMTVSPSTLAACTNTLVTLTVTDHCGNTSTCTMGIQTLESDPPIMNCPANTSVSGTYDPNGLCTAIFSPTTPVATDNCDISVTVTNNAPAVLQQGPNTITWTGTDDCGNQTVCTQIVTVECDDCCKDEQAFFLVASAVQTNAVYGNCLLNVNGTGLNDCMRITWDWGDGSPQEGPYSNNTPVSHTYSVYGNYTICYTITEVNQFGEPCFEAPFCLDKQVKCYVTCPECLNNLVKNPGFFEGAIAGELGAGGASDNWSASSGSPDLSPGIFCCDEFGIQMWGSQDKGEAICQTGFNFMPNKTYSISFSANYSQPSSIVPYVQFGFYAANSCVNPFPNCTGCETMGVSVQITDKDCATYTLPDWTPTSSFNTLIVKALTANIWPDIGFGRIDNICIQEVPENCSCGTFSQIYVRPSTGATSIALSCGGTYAFGCPNSGQSIPITGKFECVGTNCPPSSQINWTLQDPSGGITNGIVQAGPYFYLPVSPLSYASAGPYMLTLQGNCGGTDCTPCVIKFNVNCTDPCPCDVPQFQKEVEKGFATALWNNSCNACFSPIALNDCDKVEWKVNNTSVGMTNGVQSFCQAFSSPGTYTIDMIVSRFQANGSPCETFTFTKTVQITCDPAPVCDNAVFENPGFEEGAMVGGLNSGGATSNWLALWGDPHVVSDDGKWKIRLTGNLDTADVLSTETAMCFEKGPGMVTLRGSISKSRSNIKNIALFFNTGDNFEFNVFNPASCFRIATLDLAQYDSSWFDLEIPYDLSSWAALDSCGDAPHGVLVKPIVYVTSFLGNDQGGEETRSEFDLDHLCFNADLVRLDDLPRNKRLRIFPNPNPGTFTVQLPEPAKSGLSFRIINLTGQLLREPYTQTGNTLQTVQAGDLPAGLYFLQVLSEGKVLATEKFIKQ